MKKKEFDFVVQMITNQLVSFLMEDYKLSLLDAMDKVYKSQTFENLQDKGTGLYLRSAAYTYEYLKKELDQRKKY